MAAMEQLTDLLVTIGKRRHGINVYTLKAGDAGSITVPDRTSARLRRWAIANRITLHMLVADRRQIIPRVTYRYRRGLKSITDVDQLPEVTKVNLKERLT